MEINEILGSHFELNFEIVTYRWSGVVVPAINPLPPHFEHCPRGI